MGSGWILRNTLKFTRKRKKQVILQKKMILATGFNFLEHFEVLWFLMSVALMKCSNGNPQNCHLQLPKKTTSHNPTFPRNVISSSRFPLSGTRPQNPPESRQKPPRPRVVPLESYRAGDSPNGSAMYGNFSGSKPVNHLEPTTKIIVISRKCCVCQIQGCVASFPPNKKTSEGHFGIFTLKTFEPLRVLSESLLVAALIFLGVTAQCFRACLKFQPSTNQLLTKTSVLAYAGGGCGPPHREVHSLKPQ